MKIHDASCEGLGAGGWGLVRRCGLECGWASTLDMVRLALVAGWEAGGKWLGWKGRKRAGNCHLLDSGREHGRLAIGRRLATCPTFFRYFWVSGGFLWE